ncbi:thioredoxin-like domain-containing protein [Xylariomycetidae sp. FL0641]|nr:thioredoxin-like domain-containing protein [Xylariomycetidae sp. FL0641]
MFSTVMRCIPLLTLGLSALATPASAWAHVPGDELEAMIRDNEVAVVAFVNPSDEKSNRLEPEWITALEDMQTPHINTDCTASPEVCTTYGLTTSSPSTIKLFANATERATYAGPRRASTILAWVARLRRLPVTEVATDGLDDFRKADETVYLLHASADDSNAREAFRRVAERYREEFTFGITDVADGTEALVRCHKPGDDMTHEYGMKGDHGGDGEVEKALQAWVVQASRPVIAELLPHTHQRYLDRGWPIIYVFASSPSSRASVRSSLYPTAKNYYDSLTSVLVDPVDFPELPSTLGLSWYDPASSDEVAGAVHQLSTGAIYPYPRGRGWSAKDLQSWGLDVWQGRVRPWRADGKEAGQDNDKAGRGGILGGKIKSNRNVKLNIPGVRIGGRDEL